MVSKNKEINMVIVGCPGSGKGTQAEMLANKYGLKHISSGDLLRKKTNSDNSNLGDSLKKKLRSGKLIDDRIVNNIILSEMPRKNYILDGYPRKLEQVKAVENINIVIYLDTNQETAVKRLLNRKKTTKRSDDNVETIKSRMDVYKKETEPVIDYYREKGILINVDANEDKEEVFKKITEKINKKIQ